MLTPKAFADACAELAEAGLEVEILDRAALEALGMNALLGVAQGSAQPPYVAVMRWQGGGSEPPLALVGKGVCFDTGGISIKPAQGMEDMKYGHGRRRRRVRRHAGARRPQGARPTSWAWSAWPRTCPRAPRSGRATWCAAWPARPSR